jgi:hypothetical protein
MIDLITGFLAGWVLLTIVVIYAWATRDREPGRHRHPHPPAAGSHPYPYDGPLLELSVFPDFDPAPRERLETTGELRQYAFDGNIDAILDEVASWTSSLDNGDWTTAA